MAAIKVALPKPHSAIQQRIITTPGDVVVFAGRRFGKTEAMVQRILYHGARKPGLYWWVGLTWQSASMKRAWRLMSSIARKLERMGVPVEINRSTYEIRMPGIEVWYRTAANPNTLAGEGVRGAVIDEFSLMPEMVWTEFLMATLLDYNGWAAMCGVPKGNNWAARLFRQARQGELEGWTALHATTYDNPHMDPAFIERIRARTPERLFRQEYLAEIVDDAGGVFRRVTQAVDVSITGQPEPFRDYVVGIDWGRTRDKTVYLVMDATDRKVVFIDRFTKVDYPTQLNRLLALHKRWKFRSAIAEYNSMGGPMVEMAQRLGLPLVPFETNNASKMRMIDALVLAFETGAIRIPPDEDLIYQLQSFEATPLPSGMVRYGAPEGEHDDLVIALALAWQAVAEPGLSTADETLARAFALQ